MFLAIDECKEYGKKLLGLVALPLSQVPDIEKKFCSLRLETKTMGEIKWSGVTKHYLEKYIKFLDLFLDNPEATFHSITYSSIDRKYNAAYSLIRLTSWKLWNANIKERELFILFDKDNEAFPKPKVVIVNGEEFREAQEFANSYDAIKKIAGADLKFRHKICYCHQGSSHTFGLLQIADILTGAVSSVINKRDGLSVEQDAIIKHIQNKIGHAFEASMMELTMPELTAFKIHFLDPVGRYSLVSKP